MKEIWGYRRVAIYKCRKCGTTEKTHLGDGLCTTCYPAKYRKENLDKIRGIALKYYHKKSLTKSV